MMLAVIQVPALQPCVPFFDRDSPRLQLSRVAMLFGPFPPLAIFPQGYLTSLKSAPRPVSSN